MAEERVDRDEVLSHTEQFANAAAALHVFAKEHRRWQTEIMEKGKTDETYQGMLELIAIREEALALAEEMKIGL